MADVKHLTADALSGLEATGKDWTHLDDDLPVFATDEQEKSEQSIHIITTFGSEEITLRAIEEQPLDAPLNEKELVLEQKLN